MNATANVFSLTVIIDTKSGDAAGLRTTLHALAAVRRTRIELLVDGPADRSAAIDDVLTGFAQKFARIEHFLYDAPPVERANILLARATGEYLLFLRAGDRPAAQFLQSCGALAGGPDTPHVCYAALASSSGPGRPITQMHIPQQLDAAIRGRVEFAALLQAQHISWRGSLIRRELFEEFGPLDVTAPATADWDFLLRVAQSGGIFAYAGGIAAFVGDESYAFFEANDHRAYFDEILNLYERYVVPENEVALRGTAATVCDAVESHVAQMREHTPHDVDLELEMRTATLRRRAAEIAAMPIRAHTPLISVVVGGADSPPHVFARALDSLAAQTRTDFEIVYVRYGGIDYSAWIHAHPLAARIRYVHVPGEPDLAAARRLGVELTRGALIAYLDDDHAYRPRHLELLTDRALRTGAQMVFGGAGLYIEEPRNQRGGAILRRIDAFRDAGRVNRGVTIFPALTLGGVMHRAKLYPVVLDADIHLPLLHDWFTALWLIAASSTSSALIPEQTYDMYIPVGLSGTELGRLGPAAYLQSYDTVCSRVTSHQPHELAERSRVRERISALLPQWNARISDPDGLLAVMQIFGEYQNSEAAAA